MSIEIRLGYNDIFKGEKPTIKELLKNGDKLSIIKDLMALIGQKQEKGFRQIVNTQSTLRLIEHVMSLSESGTKNEVEENSLIKAFLIVNDELNNNEKSPPNLELSSQLSFARFLMSFRIYQYELDGIDIKVRLNAEITKIKLLQDYFNQNIQLEGLEKLFFEKFSIDSWKNYFFKIFRLISADLEKQRDSFIVKLAPLTQEDIDFYEKIESSDAEIGEYSDFFEIRKRPIVRLNHDEYGVLYLPFLFDKVYKSIYFELSAIGQENKETLGKIGKNFQSNFGKDFFEDVLCKQILERAYKGNKLFKCLEENELGNLTDYYIRNDKRIFLFEFKNSTIPKDVKCSNNLELIESSLLEKFDEHTDPKGKVRPKAVMQLITCIRAIYERYEENKSKFSFKNVDSFLEKKTPTVYPIVIVQDYCLDATGINYFLNDKFKSKLNGNGLSEENRKERIKNLTIIHIDYLIYLNDALKNGDIKLHDLIDEYHREAKKKKLGYPISFGQFLSKYLNSHKKFNTKPDLWKEYLQEFIK